MTQPLTPNPNLNSNPDPNVIKANIDLSLHPEFTLIEHRAIEALSIDVLIAKHNKTGAMHYHLAHPSDENAFLVGFRTQPMDSKGEAHILEHTALCGSAKYPVRDPFFSMIKRSLNTFMNAMTASDWTAYPFATQNKKDFFNLLSVYLDASFFPNIHPLDFAQEGIRVELDDNDKLQFKGIVFNEMKGAMSGEIDQLYHALAHHLYPTTTYHYNSGGDPADIPDLTHEELVAFHKSHYHPSNAVIMSFGDIPVAELQTRLHEDALAEFGEGKKHASVKEQRLTAPITVSETYHVDEVSKEQTHHVLAWLLPTITDPRERLSLRLLEGLLTEHSGSPLQAFLESHPLAVAPSPLIGLDDSHFEMVFYAGVRGSEPEHAQAIEDGILALFGQMVEHPEQHGFDADSIETILHQIEIDQRHIGGDGMPYGLNLMMEGFSTAIHDGNPVDVWQIDEHLTWLREQVQDKNWLPNLLKKHLIDNPHRVRLSLVPDANKNALLAQAEQARLDAIADNLTDADKQTLREQAELLAQRQATPDDLSLLPKVGLEDVPTSVTLKQGVEKSVTLSGQASTLYQYEAGTNGLYYYQVIIPLISQVNHLTTGQANHDDIVNHPLLPLYLGLITDLGTDKLSSREMQAKQASVSSGVTARISQRTSKNNPDELNSYFVVATRALNRKPEAINLVKEVMQDSVFTEHERIKELLKQKQTGWQSRIARAGHAYAMQTATRNMSRQSHLEYARSGLPALNALKAFLDNADADSDSNQYDKLATAIMALHQAIIALPKQAVIISEAEELERLSGLIVDSWAEDGAENNKSEVESPNPSEKDTSLTADIPDAFNTPLLDNDQLTRAASDNMAWLVATNVYHNASAYAATPAEHADTPALMVLAPYLRNGYLHGAIREQGGAYGGGASYDSNSASFKFYSYRDPHCEETFAHFANSIDWLFNEEQQPEQLEEAILGVVSGMDKPGSPAGEAVKACFAKLHVREQAWQQQMRENLLAITLDDLKRVANTYLKDKPHTKATIAPYNKADDVAKMGFVVEKIG